jgi:two-component system, NtrC family, sensor kinase
MVKRFIYLLLLLILSQHGFAQPFRVDSLKKELSVANNDTSRLILYGQIANAYLENSPDSMYRYAGKMVAVARNLGLTLEEARALGEVGFAQLNMGDYPHSLQTLLSAADLANDPATEKKIIPASYPEVDEFEDRSSSPRMQRMRCLGKIYQFLGILYTNTNNHQRSLTYHFMAEKLLRENNGQYLLTTIYLTLGRNYLGMKNQDSAFIAVQKAYDQSMQIGYKRYMGSILLNLGRIYVLQGKKDLASQYFRAAITASAEQGYYRGVAASNLALSDLYKESGQKDSVIHFARESLAPAVFLNAPDVMVRSYSALANYYRDVNDNDSAVKYQSLVIQLNDSLFGAKQAQQFQNIDFDEEQKQQQIESAKAAYRVKLRMYLLLAGLTIFFVVGFIIWRNSRRIKQANALLSRQKKELESTLEMLKTTQKQLVQSEKMASLGELTAGIAHEIQNPLNFVNNFSDVNKELLIEMKDEIEKRNLNEVKVIANDVIDNEEKINHHGKRADAIVKGMLQHSKSGAGQKEPTDINALADEYLRLAYHGMRAKDKSFNATTKTDFDNSIGTINVVQQDIGRVILNLINNAFYAVDEKKKHTGDGYEPTVSVSTKKLNGIVEISVKDNGNGIPESIKEKIFQPFFTTKPTGQGTGLGLSLSYDIVKAHGGELKVETNEGEGSEFVIQLPLN